MLDADLKTQLKSYLERVVHPLEIVGAQRWFRQRQEMAALLEDILSLSDKITVVEGQRHTRRASLPSTSPAKAPILA